MSETVTASDGDDDKLGPVREQIRKMIADKRQDVESYQHEAAAMHERAARKLKRSQETLVEVYGLELALRRLGGE